MIEQGQATEDEMIRAFVLAEMNSPAHEFEYAPLLRIAALARADAVGANPEDPMARAVYRLLLCMHRGFGRNDGIFLGFPSDVAWRHVLLGPEDFAQLRYVRNCPPWDGLSGQTLFVTEGAKSVAGGAPKGWAVDGALAVAAAIRNGETFEPLILVEDPRGGLVLVEGHTRATGYVVADRYESVPALVGTSRSMGTWQWL